MSTPWSERLSALGYLAGWALVRRAPQAAVRRLFRLGADRASRNGRGMEQLRRNLARVVGAENVTVSLVRDSVRSYARYWAEAFRLPSLVGTDTLVERIGRGVVGEEKLRASLAAGRGVVLVLPHSGNWDMAGVYLAARYGTFTTVAERVRPEKLFEAFVDYRTRLGFEVLAHAGGPPPMHRLTEVLRAGRVVCLLGERDLGGHGEPVDFFGEQTTMPVGAVELALRTGAALHVVHCWFTPGGWGFSVGDPVAHTTRAEMMQAVAGQFATNIAAHPADWHMLQPLWPADRRHRPSGHPDRSTGRHPGGHSGGPAGAPRQAGDHRGVAKQPGSPPEPPGVGRRA